MPFTPGDHVHVAAFGKGTVLEVRNSGRYLVDVKGRSMLVGESQLTGAGNQRARRRREAAAQDGSPELAARTQAPATLDLHGKTADEALAALDVFLNDAMLAGLPELRVIHGRSGGRLKAAVHRRLAALSSVRTFRVDPTNPGVTIVVL